jgi:hypothetical protein
MEFAGDVSYRMQQAVVIEWYFFAIVEGPCHRNSREGCCGSALKKIRAF